MGEAETVGVLLGKVQRLADQVAAMARREAVGRVVMRSMIATLEHKHAREDAKAAALRDAMAVLDRLDMEACTK